MTERPQVNTEIKPETQVNPSNNPEQRAEDVISRVFKGDISALEEFIKNPLETLKNSFIEMLRQIFGNTKTELN